MVLVASINNKKKRKENTKKEREEERERKSPYLFTLLVVAFQLTPDVHCCKPGSLPSACSAHMLDSCQMW